MPEWLNIFTPCCINAAINIQADLPPPLGDPHPPAVPSASAITTRASSNKCRSATKASISKGQVHSTQKLAGEFAASQRTLGSSTCCSVRSRAKQPDSLRLAPRPAQARERTRKAPVLQPKSKRGMMAGLPKGTPRRRARAGMAQARSPEAMASRSAVMTGPGFGSTLGASGTMARAVAQKRKPLWSIARAVEKEPTQAD